MPREKPTVSIIVPVYNVEKYLPACIDSILAQTFRDFELILVDDGSPDGSQAILEQYAQKDSRVRAFRKENGGVSSARNFGLERAEGEYIGFVDADEIRWRRCIWNGCMKRWMPAAHRLQCAHTATYRKAGSRKPDRSRNARPRSWSRRKAIPGCARPAADTAGGC